MLNYEMKVLYDMTSSFHYFFMRAQHYLRVSTAPEVSFWKYAEIVKIRQIAIAYL